jgi:signal transduction histidine kinase/CheY-like chemotaxis protein/HPt (histidine-containing phosphotransfer) domain-containing protein
MLQSLSRFGFLLFYAAALTASGWFLVAKFEDVSDVQKNERLAALDAVRAELSDSAFDAQVFVELMQSTMEDELRDRPRNAPPSRLHMALEEGEAGAFNLDNLPSGLTKLDVGNLTGLGGLKNRDPEFYTEIEVALSLRSVFRGVLTQLPNAAWCYYVSARRFEHVYPWQSSSDFAFEDVDLEQEYYVKGTPDLNPSRAPYVTDVYEDDAGKGLMITIGRPVYADNRFMGIVALDFTLGYIDGILAKFPKKYGDVYLVDGKQRVIGYSDRTPEQSEIELPVFLAESPLLAPDNIGDLPRAERIDQSLVVVQGMSALPFALVSMMPANQVTSQVIAGTTLEILIFSAALALLGFIEWRRRIAGRILEQSLALAKAKEEAEGATKAKSAFLAMMSHEIRTPMNGVMSMAEMLDQTELSEDQRGMSAVIRSSATALLTIINDILDFSKIEAGKLDVENAPFSLVEVVESAGELICARAEDKGITLAIVIEPATPDRVRGDPTRLRQILINLMGNAVKFTDTGSVTVRVLPAAENNIRFEVIDTGIGLTVEQQGRLFKAFEQADVSTSRRYGGTGLGLSISQRLCTLMHGRIGVQSETGVGSTFWIELPLVADLVDTASAYDISDAKIIGVGFFGTTREAFDAILEAAGVRNYKHVSFDDDVVAAVTGIENIVFFSAQGGDPRGLAIGQEVSARGVPVRALILAAPRSLASTLSESDRAGFLSALTLPLRRTRAHLVIAAALGRANLNERTAIANESFDPPTEAAAAAAGALVLVAEDNATNQVVIRRMLHKLGYALELAGDGRAALEKYRAGVHGLVITDFHMPEMDGFELTAELRRREASTGGRVPIIALTADALPGTERRCMDAGMDGYLTKPIDSKLLVEALHKWLPSGLALRRVRETQFPQTQLPEERIDPLIFNSVPLKETFGSLKTDARAFLMKFVGDARGMAEAVNAAMDASDWSTARDHAHALKGAALSLGAVRLGELAAEVQDYLDKGDPETALLFSGGLETTVSELAQAVAPLMKAV